MDRWFDIDTASTRDDGLVEVIFGKEILQLDSFGMLHKIRFGGVNEHTVLYLLLYVQIPTTAGF